jgi:hypothetical protein
LLQRGDGINSFYRAARAGLVIKGQAMSALFIRALNVSKQRARATINDYSIIGIVAKKAINPAIIKNN